MIAEVDIDALHADRPLGIGDHEAHLRDALHHAHRLTGLGQQVELPGDVEIPIEQHRDVDSRDLLQLPRLLRRVAIDDVDVRPLAEGRNGLLQLTELLNTELSGDPHM